MKLSVIMSGVAMLSLSLVACNDKHREDKRTHEKPRADESEEVADKSSPEEDRSSAAIADKKEAEKTVSELQKLIVSSTASVVSDPTSALMSVGHFLRDIMIMKQNTDDRRKYAEGLARQLLDSTVSGIASIETLPGQQVKGVVDLLGTYFDNANLPLEMRALAEVNRQASAKGEVLNATERRKRYEQTLIVFRGIDRSKEALSEAFKILNEYTQSIPGFASN